MIEPIAGWSCEQRDSGLVMTPPAGEAAGGIRYVERVRPLRRMADLVRELPTAPGYRTIAISEVEPVVTVEGEYGAVVVIDGELDGAPVQRTIGAVFADDFYSLTVGVARSAGVRDEIRAQVRSLVRHDAHMLGVRRRRFVHAPPPGWHGFFTGSMQVQWVPLDYPRDGSSLTVYPALPAGDDPASQAEALARLHTESQPARAAATLAEPTPIQTREGLSGRWWTVLAAGAGDRVHDVIVFEDDRYIYPIVMQSDAASRAGHLALLAHLAASIEAIPRPPRVVARAAHAELLSHWVD